MARNEDEAARIFKRVLPSIKPSDDEIREIVARVNTLTARLRRIVPRDVEIRVVGSIAKSTNLKGDADIDLFMLFGREHDKESLSALGLGYAKRLVEKKKGERYEVKYAEHPYVRVYLEDGVKADIVPASKVDDSESLATAVDRTPLHAEFINANLSDKQRDEVRLLKYLLKSHSIYGAEIKTGGFSGYLCELLIHQYGSLFNLLEGISRLKLPMVIYPLNKTEASDEAAAKRFGKGLVVIDPVDSKRNVAAALTEESLARFVLIAREFIARPSLDAFYGKGFPSGKAPLLLENLIRASGLKFFLIITSVPDKSQDIIWPQLRKVSLLIEDELRRHGFETYISLQWISGLEGFMLMATPELKVAARLAKGPDVFKTAETSSFMSKHKNAIGFIIRKSTVHALEAGRYSYAHEILEDVVKGRLIKGRKDISFKRSRLFSDKMPKRHSEQIYSELVRALGI